MNPERAEALRQIRFIEDLLQSPDTSLADLDYLLDLYNLAYQWLKIIEAEGRDMSGRAIWLADERGSTGPNDMTIAQKIDVAKIEPLSTEIGSEKWVTFVERT
jgi:hypothetical protein